MTRSSYDERSDEGNTLEKRLRAVEPSATLASPWFIQRVVAYGMGQKSQSIGLPHAHLVIIPRQRLVEIAARQHLPLPGGLPDEPCITLIALDDLSTPADNDDGPAHALNRCWALLFHARVDATVWAALTGRTGAPVNAASPEMWGGMFDATPPTAIGHARQRIARVGRSRFAEARFVLERERYIHGDADDAVAWREFAAVFLELRYFYPARLGGFFPSIDDRSALAALITEDFDADELLRETRPEGAADLPRGWETASGDWEPPDGGSNPPDAQVLGGWLGRLFSGGRPKESPRRCAALLERAEAASNLGNVVRAASLRMRAYRLTRDGAGAIHTRAREDLAALVGRLALALNLDETNARDWSNALGPSSRRPPAAGGTPRGGFSTTCKRSASITSGTFIWSASSTGCLRSAVPRCCGRCLDRSPFSSASIFGRHRGASPRPVLSRRRGRVSTGCCRPPCITPRSASARTSAPPSP